MAMMNRMRVGLKATGTTVSIPDDPAAKLMYYLNSMCTVLRLDDNEDINRLKDFRNYHLLSHTDRNVLIHLCLLLKPDVLLDKCIFQDDAMCGNSSNEFYDLQTVRDQFLITNSIMIGGQQTRVTKIMTFKMAWLRNNWGNPIQALLARQEREKQMMMSRAQTAASCVIL